MMMKTKRIRRPAYRAGRKTRKENEAAPAELVLVEPMILHYFSCAGPPPGSSRWRQ